MAQYKLVQCTINGKKVEKMVDTRASLTDMLRNDFRLTAVKKGCEVGECGEISDIQQAFMDETAIQCGFCTPGFILTATEILAAGKEYSDDELRKLLSGHLCRCTGYQNIFRAVKKTMLRRLGKHEEAEAVR